MPAPRILPFALSLALGLPLALGASSCVQAIEVPDEGPGPGELPVGATTQVELRYLRLDVKNFEQALDLAALRKLPRKTLDELWLLDFDMTSSVGFVLDELAALSPAEADELTPAAQNMRKLLSMTADNVRLEGTKLEDMIALAGAVGLPPARVLAALMQTGVTDNAIPFDVVADVFLDLLLGSHPNAQQRKGPVDAAHPDGLYPITPRSLPITLGDVVYNFESLPTRFGPVDEHPGFVIAATGITKGEDAFKMYVRVNLNALPYKGVDLTSSYVASVNSTDSQIARVFDFDDPDWMRIEGLKDELEIAEMTVRILENDDFIAGGSAREPAPLGNSPAWDLPDWEFERLIIEMARKRTELIGDHCDAYELGTGVNAFEACVDGTGWTEMTTFTDIGNPPPPAYFWDVLAEVAQVRLHDPISPGGTPIPEGEADVEFTLKNIKIPLDEPAILAGIKGNLSANPQALADITELLNDNSDGDADFYYYRPDDAAADDDDYLYFITADDLRVDAEGEPVRPYSYAHPGFYADAGLAEKLSDTAEIDGDTTHEKLKVSPGQTVYVEDDAGHVFKVEVGEKPARSSLSLALTRVR
ncbi:MAG: acetyltransferase [Nannocystis sp.]|nr:hypothetical protein [Nannocystis sp.]MBA3545127.1 acetyltransferase [Nannocystis sp.]